MPSLTGTPFAVFATLTLLSPEQGRALTTTMKRDLDSDLEQRPETKKTKTGSGSMGPGDQGNLYQKRWILYITLLAYETKEEFHFRFELPEAGAFDDILLEIKNNLFFVQVKHTSNNENITECKLFKKQKNATHFFLEKYNQSWNEISSKYKNVQHKNVHCILLAKHALGNNAIKFFQKIDKSPWQPFLYKDKGSNAEKSGTSWRLDNSNSELKNLDEGFLKTFTLMTEQQSLDELEQNIKNMLKKEFGDNTENVFNMLESEITRLVQAEKKQGIRRGRKWLDKLFEIFRQKNYLDFFKYMFQENVNFFSKVTISSTKAQQNEETIEILPYEKSYHLQMIQAKQIVKENPFCFVPLNIMKKMSCLMENVKKALSSSNKKIILILLDDMNDDIEHLKKILSLKNTKLIIITNRASMLQTELKSLKIKNINILPNITLGDLETGKDYQSYTVIFQGVEQKLKQLPSCENFKKELNGDSLEKFVQNEKLNIGLSLLNGLNNHYEPRKLSEVTFENAELKTYQHYKSSVACDKFYKDHEKPCVTEEIDEDKFIDNCIYRKDRRMTIIGGETGVGKSSTMRRLAFLHKSKYHSKWAIFIDLSGNPLIEKRDESEEHINEAWIKEFLEKAAISSRCPKYEVKYFHSCLPDEIVLYIDSFHECINTYAKKTFKILKMLKESYRIIISSRRSEKLMLLSKWKDSAVYRLIPLSFNNQLNILEKVLAAEGKPLPENTTQLLKNLEIRLSSNRKVKLGETLAVHMLAKIVGDRSGRDFAVSNFTLFDLFEKYVECYVRDFLLKKKLSYIESDYFELYLKDEIECVYDKMGKISLSKKLPEQLLDQVPITQGTLKKLEGHGKLNGLTSPNLSHQSLVDFFFAHSMYDKYSSVNDSEDKFETMFWNIFKENFKKNNLEREFFFNFLSKEVKSEEINYENRKVFQKLLTKINNDNEYDSVTESELNLTGVKELLKNS